ncbi:MAG: SRPBCC domain-containing protein [Methylocella sp.]
MNAIAESSLSLEISRRFDAKPERVFDAWLSKEWGEWLPPRGARCEVILLEPRVGGRYQVSMTMQDGRPIEISGVYRELIRPEKLVFTWLGSYNSQETLITLTFKPDGTGTQMNMRQDGFADTQLRDGYNSGWTGEKGSFDKLAAFLAKTATDIELIGVAQSTFVRTVRIACEEKGVAYRLTPASPHSPEVNAIHPLGKIPVLRHGHFELFESKAIATYIDRAFPGPRLFPDDAVACAQIEQWVSVANTAILPVLSTYLQSYFFPRTANGQPDRVTINRVVPEVETHIALFNKAVADTGHLVGRSFTYADMNLLPMLAYLHELPESSAMLAQAKELARYLDRHGERASFKATVPPPFGEPRPER